MSLKLNPDILKSLRDSVNKSTRVVAWYPHPIEGQVRGPFRRWIQVTGEDKNVASIGDETEFVSNAMNALEPLLDLVEELQKENLTLQIEAELSKKDD